jgi:hypothetical protein
MIVDVLIVLTVLIDATGGALVCKSCSVEWLRGCLFRENVAFLDGGAVYWADIDDRSNHGALIGCQFERNAAGRRGGGKQTLTLS